MTETTGQHQRRAAVAAAVGNVVEWYDWAVYALLAFAFSKQFFPTDSEVAALISTFAVFAVGFIARPIGSVTLGRVTDRMGRTAAMALTVAIMAAASLLIGLAPTAASIGIWASIWLVMMRLAQGLALGAETSAVGAFLAESAGRRNRGFLVSVYGSTAVLGTLIGSVIALVLSAVLTEQQMSDFGWRIPFLFGGLLGLLAFVVRRKSVETLPEDFTPDPHPLRTLWRHYRPLIGMTMILGGSLGLSYFVLITGFAPIVQALGASDTVAHAANTVGLVLLCALTPVFGWLSDRWGRRPILAFGLISMFILVIPGIALLWDPSADWRVYVAQLLVVVPIAAINGTVLITLIERYPVRLRGMAFGFTWAVTLAIFGGTGPMIATALAAEGRTFTMGAYFLIMLGIGSVIALRMKETAHSPMKP